MCDTTRKTKFHLPQHVNRAAESRKRTIRAQRALKAKTVADEP